ncbi:hypothetical protein PUN4_720007 [Paraburkholderia unamae]|nr:hypothetical protein PUN4_720007 [Paraburkholderia unamae]
MHFVFFAADDREDIGTHEIRIRNGRRVDDAAHLAQHRVREQHDDGAGQRRAVMACAAQHAHGCGAPKRRGGIDALNRALVAHDDAAAQKAHAGNHISRDLRDAARPVAGQCAERDEQARAARHERDGAQTRRALAHLAFESNGDAAGERREKAQGEFESHRFVMKARAGGALRARAQGVADAPGGAVDHTRDAAARQAVGAAMFRSASGHGSCAKLVPFVWRWERQGE